MSRSILLPTLLGCIFSCFQLAAQDIDRFLPKLSGDLTGSGEVVTPPLPDSPLDSDDEALGTIFGIALRGNPNQVAVDNPPSVAGVQVLDETLIVPEEVKAALEKYINGPLSLDSVNGVTRDAILAYRDAGLPVVDVGLPEQNVSTGILQLVVIIGRAGDISVEGNRYYNDSIYTRSFSIEEGDVLWEDQILRDLSFLNRSPYREVGLIYTPGDDFGDTDVIISANEQRPYSAYFGYENTGNNIIGEDRIFFGLEWGNVFGWDHTIAYQYTTTPDFEGVHGHSWIYRAPIPQLRHEFQMVASYVETDSQIPALGGGFFGSGGRSTQLSPNYVIPLDRLYGYEHEIQFGFDFKSTNNTLEFGGIRVTDSTAEIMQFGIGQLLTKQTRNGRQRFFHRLVWSPGDLSNHNTDALFQQLRAFASADYVYWNGQFTQAIDLPHGFTFVADLEGQIANGNLLPSETLILGGIGSVRGFEQNVTRADRGAVLNLELYSPSISPLSWLLPRSDAETIECEGKGGKQLVANTPKAIDQARLFGFFDYALASNVERLPFESDHITLGSAGLGLDYRIARHFSAQIAHGWQIEQDGFFDPDDSRWHISATARW